MLYLVNNMPKGEKNKLTDKEKKEIFNLKGKKSAYAIAKQYHISHTMVYKIWRTGINQKKPIVVNQTDTQILKKIIPVFARLGVKIEFEEGEIERIKELAKEALRNA